MGDRNANDDDMERNVSLGLIGEQEPLNHYHAIKAGTEELSLELRILVWWQQSWEKNMDNTSQCDRGRISPCA